MAGRGPAPTGRAVRRNRQSSERVVRVAVSRQPRLPKYMPGAALGAEGNVVHRKWPAATKRWWQMWRESPLAATFTDNDWQELLTAAVLHAEVWSGNTKAAAELRLRVAKFGATPEDRARLRINFATADEAEDRRDTRRSAGAESRRRYGSQGLHAV